MKKIPFPAIFLKGKKRGISLIETMFAATLLGFIIMTLFTLYPSSIMAIKHAEHRIEAANLAQSVLEEKKAGPFAELENALIQTELPGTDDTPYTLEYTTFPVTVEGEVSSLLKGIRIKVTWYEKENQYSVTDETIVCYVKP